MEVNFRRSVIIAELRRPEVARHRNFVSNFCVFLKNRPLMAKFSKFCSESFHRLTDRRCYAVFKWRKICPTGNRLNRALFTGQKNFVGLSNCRYCAYRAQNLLGQPPTFGSQCSKFHRNWFTLGGVIAERVKAVLLVHKVFALFA